MAHQWGAESGESPVSCPEQVSLLHGKELKDVIVRIQINCFSFELPFDTVDHICWWNRSNLAISGTFCHTVTPHVVVPIFFLKLSTQWLRAAQTQFCDWQLLILTGYVWESECQWPTQRNVVVPGVSDRGFPFSELEVETNRAWYLVISGPQMDRDSYSKGYCQTENNRFASAWLSHLLYLGLIVEDPILQWPAFEENIHESEISVWNPFICRQIQKVYWCFSQLSTILWGCCTVCSRPGDETELSRCKLIRTLVHQYSLTHFL